jgi:uncharacterized circularly permuted ATP-grasp superfamily protein
MTDRISSQEYFPDLGFIGHQEVRVANYLFESGTGRGHAHARRMVAHLLARTPMEHSRSSRKLSRLLEARGLTFQKQMKDGSQRTFAVPVTASVVPLSKEVFDRIANASAVLMTALRAVLQDIYGSGSPGESRLIRSLGRTEGERIQEVIRCSPHYFPALHHPVMRDYPFMDVVGLDLVFVGTEDARTQNEIPFRMLELNAGSPSGASNNTILLEGLARTEPKLLEALGPILPNDHFQVLRETYRSLGETWTGRGDGIQVILPPGGANGASPEIHTLSARSGLVYCESGHLYRDGDGFVRMRSLGVEDPVVTAIYSRVNSDSILYDPKAGILLRDPDSGKVRYWTDPLVPWPDPSRPCLIRDEQGRPVPLESPFAVPGALSAIHGRKLYVGGLNRLLDDKTLLPLLTRKAPKIFRDELIRAGLDPECPPLRTPDALPSRRGSVRMIERNPEEWVVKSPHLSGGKGVHILMALPVRERNRVLRRVRQNPEAFAYQRVVRMGRIPVSGRSSGQGEYRFANHAADLRMWTFFGGEGMVPRLTRNALVRFAPEERGPLSSVVNTSQGGGYAPFVIVDQPGGSEGCSALDVAQPPVNHGIEGPIPVFAAAQMVQVTRILEALRKELRSEVPGAYRIHGHLLSLQLQAREVAAFLHPEAMDVLFEMLQLVDGKLDHRKIASVFGRKNSLQARVVSELPHWEKTLSPGIMNRISTLHALSPLSLDRGLSEDQRREDLASLRSVEFRSSPISHLHRKVLPMLRGLLKHRIPDRILSRLELRRLVRRMDAFDQLNRSHWRNVAALREDAPSPLIYVEAPASGTALAWEQAEGRSLAESEWIAPWVQEARQEWMRRCAGDRVPDERERELHFHRHPRLKRLQVWIDLQAGGDLSEILNLLPVLPYAEFNLRSYARMQGIRVEDVFTSRPVPDRIERTDDSGCEAGSCFARKTIRHGRFFESLIYVRVSRKQSPLCQAYTIGHELHHAAQIRSFKERELKAVEAGPFAVATFMSDFGTFFGFGAEPTDSGVSQPSRPALYGLPDRILSDLNSPVITELSAAIAAGDDHYVQALRKYGSWLGCLMPVSPSVRVKAFREVYPALENLKNLVFASQCGLRLPVDPVAAALPTGNPDQIARVREFLIAQSGIPVPSGETLRILASHQLFGVGFGKESLEDERLVLRADPGPINPGHAYNQSQQ